MTRIGTLTSTLILFVFLSQIQATPTGKNSIDTNDELVVFNPVSSSKSLEEKRADLISKFLDKDRRFNMELTRNGRFFQQTSHNIKDHQFKWQPIVKYWDDKPTTNTEATFKEYLSVFSDNIMDPKFGLFYSNASRVLPIVGFASATSTDRFPHNPGMVAKFVSLKTDASDYLKDLRLIGKVIAMAILNKQHMDVTFEDKLYEMIIGRKIYNFTAEANGPSKDFKMNRRGNTLNYFPRSNNPDAVRTGDSKAFSLTFPDKEVLQDAVLMIHAFHENESMFPMAVLCNGIFDIIPQEAFAVFSKDEIRTLISGDTRELQLSDWHRFSGVNFQNIDDLQSIVWFWDYIKGADKQVHYQLLSFITGTSRLPIGLLDVADQSKLLNPFIDVIWPSIPKKKNCARQTEPAPPKPYINFVWSEKTDSPPTSDPYTNTLYLSSYTSRAIMENHIADLLKTMCGVSTWFVSAARLR